MRSAAAVTLPLLVVGCTGAPEASPTTVAQPTPLIIYVTPEPTPSPTPSPPATPSPSPSPSPTSTVAPSPTERPTPRPPAEADVGEPMLFIETFAGQVFAYVAVVIVNTGDGWIQLQPENSNWAIYDPEDALTDVDLFAVAGPVFLSPGQTGYMYGVTFADAPAGDFHRVEMQVRYRQSDERAEPVAVDSIDPRNNRNLGTAEITGRLLNVAGRTSPNVTILGVFFDQDDQPIGFAWEYMEDVAADEERPFKLTPYVNVDYRDVVRVEVHASGE